MVTVALLTVISFAIGLSYTLFVPQVKEKRRMVQNLLTCRVPLLLVYKRKHESKGFMYVMCNTCTREVCKVYLMAFREVAKC